MLSFIAMSNTELIQKFYTSFQKKDFKAMQECYADGVHFSDDAFPGLIGKQAKAMWHMLAIGGKDLQLTFSNVTANETTGSCDWVATYTFSLTGNKVINKVHAEFEFNNGKITRHTDSFDFYKWAGQAFGFKGQLLGWTSFFKNKVQATTKSRLAAFIKLHPEYNS